MIRIVECVLKSLFSSTEIHYGNKFHHSQFNNKFLCKRNVKKEGKARKDMLNGGKQSKQFADLELVSYESKVFVNIRPLLVNLYGTAGCLLANGVYVGH